MSLFVLKERKKKGRSQEVFWVAQMASKNAGFAPGKMIMGVLSNRVSKSQVLPGDHIYSWRSAYTYAHHGIYAGDDQVIHFTRGRDEELGTGTIFDVFLVSSRPTASFEMCEKCGMQANSSGVLLSCLDCFLLGGPLYRFEYDIDPVTFLLKARGGTCTFALSDDKELVLHRAKYLLDNGFGCYHIFRNNCEDFAIYCKTGLLVEDRNMIGRSGQAASFLGAPLAAVVSTPLRFVMTSPWGFAAVTVGVYCFSRYAADIGVRRDVAKVAVEDLAVHVGSSTVAEQPNATIAEQPNVTA
ncbi:hypothetical protein CY35_01G195800 [Sphagnum magellanicum]|jgi:hypothetical protein|nr:hypothetical protein CY35_01G195800 [Sphagnum magellanicum]KAH9577083.1 hypothetical protein CY35_01G195800 [Sphagnum magellanicum]